MINTSIHNDQLIIKTNKPILIEEFINSLKIPKKKLNHLMQTKQMIFNLKDPKYFNKHDCITINIFEDLNYKPLNKAIDVIYEDDSLLVINKPSQIIIHSDTESSLCQMVAQYYIDHHIHSKIRFSNRLDKDTTGLIVFNKHFIIAPMMDYLFSTHQINKTYIAIVEGKLKHQKGSINKPIGKDRHIQGAQRCHPNGQSALTHYEVMDYNPTLNLSLLQVQIETGRKHQIRVHLASIGHPILGDQLYGKSSDLINRYALHAYELSFNHPLTSKPMLLNAPIPNDMLNVIKQIKKDIA